MLFLSAAQLYYSHSFSISCNISNQNTSSCGTLYELPYFHIKVVWLYNSGAVDTLYTVRFKKVSGLSSFKNFQNQTTGCEDIAYYLVGYFILSHHVVHISNLQDNFSDNSNVFLLNYATNKSASSMKVVPSMDYIQSQNRNITVDYY